MSEYEETDDVVSEGNEPKDDGLKNFKSEVGRKLDNIDSRYEQLLRQNQELIEALKPKPVEKPYDPSEDENLMLENPAEYTRRIQERATREALKAVEQRDMQRSRETQILNQLVSDYPELSNANHDLTKAAVKIYESMDDYSRSSPVAYQTAVQQAALKLGVRPASYRDNASENFALGSGSGNRNNSKKGKGKESDPDLPQETLEFAKIMGIDISKPETLKRMKSRKSYGRYQ